MVPCMNNHPKFQYLWMVHHLIYCCMNGKTKCIIIISRITCYDITLLERRQICMAKGKSFFHNTAQGFPPVLILTQNIWMVAALCAEEAWCKYTWYIFRKLLVAHRMSRNKMQQPLESYMQFCMAQGYTNMRIWHTVIAVFEWSKWGKIPLFRATSSWFSFCPSRCNCLSEDVWITCCYY